MLPSFPPQFLRVFEGDPQKTLKANPHSHLEILALNLKNSALILTSNFENFRGIFSNILEFSRILENSQFLLFPSATDMKGLS